MSSGDSALDLPTGWLSGKQCVGVTSNAFDCDGELLQGAEK